MMNKITQKGLAYATAIGLSLAGAGYLGAKAFKEPSVPKEIAYVNAIQESLDWATLKDKSIQKVLDSNKLRLEKIQENPELAPYISNLENILSSLPNEYLTSTEDDLYNRTKEIIQRELKKIKNAYPSEKGTYGGAALAIGVLAPAIALLGYLDISNKKKEEESCKRYSPRVKISNSENLIGNVLCEEYKPKNKFSLFK